MLEIHFRINSCYIFIAMIQRIIHLKSIKIKDIHHFENTWFECLRFIFTIPHKQLFGSRVINFAVASNHIRFILITFTQLRQFLKHGFAPRRHHTWLNQMQSEENEVGSPNQKNQIDRNLAEPNQFQRTTKDE